MSVCGSYIDRFDTASHVCFDGHMDDPFFRAIAIQKITSIEDGHVVCSKSGKLRIKNGKRQSVRLQYKGFFGSQTTNGYPFKDTNTEAISANHVMHSDTP